jgi:hypothetical protein
MRHAGYVCVTRPPGVRQTTSLFAASFSARADAQHYLFKIKTKKFLQAPRKRRRNAIVSQEIQDK